MSFSAIKALDGRAMIWEPLPKQALAMACPADEVFFGGTKGGGKTDLMVMRPAPLLQLAQEKFERTGILQSNCLIVIIRKTLNEARDMINRSKVLYPQLDPTMGADGWNQTEKIWRFTSGAQVIFAHLDGPDDHRRWNGVQICGLGIDELPECCDFEVFKYLVGQVRSTDPDYEAHKYVLATGNPGGKYSDWVFEYFIEPAPRGSVILENEVTLEDGRIVQYTRAFIESHLRDNPYLANSGVYEANLRSMTANQQRWFLKGDWSGVMDGYFSGVLDPEIHFIDSHDVPSGVDVGIGIDWGEGQHPACSEFGYRDPRDNSITFFDELYGPGVTGRDWGNRMLDKVRRQTWSKHHRWRVEDFICMIDPMASWSRASARGAGDAITIPGAIASCGFRVFPAINDRIVGWRQMVERMSIGPDKRAHIYVMRDRCPNLVKQLQRIMPDAKKPGDLDTTMPDHALDAARYLCMQWPFHYATKAAQEADELTMWLRSTRRRDEPESDMYSTGYGD